MNGPVKNDPSILDTDVLFRKIRGDWVVWDENLGRTRPSSQAFQNLAEDSFSVILASLVKGPPEDLLASFPGYGLVSFTAGEARGLEQGVYPKPEPDDPAHAHVHGKKSGKVKNDFAKMSRWVVEISKR